MEKRTKFSIWYYILVILMMFLIQVWFFSGSAVKEISYKQFLDSLDANKISSVVLTSDKIHGLFKAEKDSAGSKTAQAVSAKESEKIKEIPKATPWRLQFEKYEQELKRRFYVVRVGDKDLIKRLEEHHVDFKGKLESNWLGNFLMNWIIPLLFVFFIWGILIRRMGAGPQALQIGKSKAKIYAEDPKNKVTFKDVAGIDEAVEEVREVVEFLSNPAKYTRLGAKLPKGILLVGPPGTGKTLLAKAVAGEAGVPFFSISGSDFVEMFVGVGAARVRDLFAEARSKAPCIIFIDEIDAIGKSRATGPVIGGHDERENTLNQLLVEMDGFDPKLGIILMAATNRPDVLDPALLRPGRFDRQVLVDRPDLNGREAIFKVHTRPLILGDDVDLRKLAAQTPGFAGAEIANVCNEAALLASRKNKDKITMEDFMEAIERVIAGLEKKNKLINERERKIVAYHESGHAIVGHFTPGADPVQKVSIVPRGMSALGYTLQTPLEDRYLMSREELLGKIKGLLGGRAAEELTFGEISTGAANDIERASKIARNMIMVYGMSKKLPNVSFVENEGNRFMGQGPQLAQHSAKVAQLIDDEVQEILDECYRYAKDLLTEKKDKLEQMATVLLDKEVIMEDDITKILGPRPEKVATASGNKTK